MQILGSQYGIILFMFIGLFVAVVIEKVRKEKLGQEEAESIIGTFAVIGFIVAIVCFIIYQCTHPED